MAQNQSIRSLAYAGTIGLAGLLEGCTSPKHHKANLDEFRADHYSQITELSEESFNPRPSSAVMFYPNGTENFRYVAIDVRNKVPTEDVKNTTQFHYDLVITRDLEKYPLPLDGKEMKWNRDKDEGKPIRHLISIARQGGPYEDKILVQVPIETVQQWLADPSFKERISKFWSPLIGNWKIMSEEHQAGLYNDNRRYLVLEEMAKEQK